jgi:hypothetical protein
MTNQAAWHAEIIGAVTRSLIPPPLIQPLRLALERPDLTKPPMRAARRQSEGFAKKMS